MTLAVVACGPDPIELRPSRAVPPTPPYGLVVGVTAGAVPPSMPMLAGERVEYYLPYAHQLAGLSGELHLGGGVYQGTEAGMQVGYRPFALKLPAGRGEFMSFAVRRYVPKQRQEQRYVTESYKDSQGKWQTRGRHETVTVTDYVPIVSNSPIPDTSFEVAAGEVRYIGRFGLFTMAGRHMGPGSPTCRKGSPEPVMPTQLFAREPPACVVRDTFVENESAADLAMIRQHFPHLATVDIQVRQVETPPGKWQSLADLVRSYAAGP